ncbi:Late blight resistance protein R1-A [Camellia lanceoleosa]|uniref:Late blight resistance protein R1-A n=1 Tax=Camellia lanceoleosa TaxID=1840588 RepID=A0ACC0G1T6_9ERIC|nr:Late blight resistance protein R1-A [Camellia lanceoleosa]
MEQTARFKREMGEKYSVLGEDTARFEREEDSEEDSLSEKLSLREHILVRKAAERFLREMGEYSVLEKHRERFEREMGENYSVLEKLNLMISKACNLTADQIDHLDSFCNRLRFLATILKDLEEKQQQQHELNYEPKNLPMQIDLVICKTRQLIRSFDVDVPGQRDSNNNGDSFFDILIGTNIMEEIKTIEAKVVQFYDQINQIQLLQDFNDGVHSSMSMENRTMVDEEITVGFDDEALTIKELLAGGKKQLQIISIVGMPGLGQLTRLVNLRYLAINLKSSDELPPSISNLSNLETLIIISTLWIEVILPCNVWKIPKLRHLYAKGGAKYDVSLCSEEAVTDHNHPSILENLRTMANVNPCGHVQDLLARTPFLTKLGICGHLLSDSGNLMFLNLEFLRHLETLKLLNEFSYPTNFREVKFPTNVKRLTLKCTNIEWEDISILGMLLPNLELLKLENSAGWGRQWATTDGGFPRLKFLKLKDYSVKQWITCSSHFPSLQHLLLDGCISLEEIPFSLGDILTLQMIELVKDEDCLAMASLLYSESNKNCVFKGAIRENIPIRD